MAGFNIHLEELVQPGRRLGAQSRPCRRYRRNEYSERFVSNQLNLVRLVPALVLTLAPAVVRNMYLPPCSGRVGSL